MTGRAAFAALLVVVGCCGAPPGPPQPDVPATTPSPAPRGNCVSTGVWAGLDWLKARQSKDGSWDGDVAATGLALLAFLGAGRTHQSGADRDTVANGLKWLRGVQDAEGRFGPRSSAGFPRSHAIAALAMTEAYGMTGSRSLIQPVRRGVAFALTTAAPGEVETTVRSVMLFKSFVLSELDADGRAAAAIRERVAELRLGADGGTDSAIVLFAKILAGHTPDDDPPMSKAADALVAAPPRWDADEDLERVYFGTQALRQFGGERWVKWNTAMNRALVDHQRLLPEDAERGSWDPVGVGRVAQGGRVWSTALCCMDLEVYFGGGHISRVWK